MDTPEKVMKAAKLMAADESLTVAAAAKKVGMPETTLRRRLLSDDPLKPDRGYKRPDNIMKAVHKLVS